MNISALIFVCLYATLMLYTMLQIAVAVRQGHKRRSFKMAFNALCASWSLLRWIFWLLVLLGTDMNVIGLYILFWLPHNIQFATFSLLSVFFAKVIFREGWRAHHRWRAYSLYAFMMFLHLGTIVGLATMMDSDKATDYSNAEAWCTGTLFALLAISFIAIGRSLNRLDAADFSRMFVLEPDTISIVTYALGVLFTARSAFDFVSAAGVFTFSIEDKNWKGDMIVLGFYCVTELFPIVLLLSTIAKGRRRGQQRLGGHSTAAKDDANFPDFGVFAAAAGINRSGSGWSSSSEDDRRGSATPGSGRRPSDMDSLRSDRFDVDIRGEASHGMLGVGSADRMRRPLLAHEDGTGYTSMYMETSSPSTGRRSHGGGVGGGGGVGQDHGRPPHSLGVGTHSGHSFPSPDGVAGVYGNNISVSEGSRRVRTQSGGSSGPIPISAALYGGGRGSGGAVTVQGSVNSPDPQAYDRADSGRDLVMSVGSGARLLSKQDALFMNQNRYDTPPDTAGSLLASRAGRGMD